MTVGIAVGMSKRNSRDRIVQMLGKTELGRFHRPSHQDHWLVEFIQVGTVSGLFHVKPARRPRNHDPYEDTA